MNGQFLKQPINQTATFGDFVDYECRVSDCNGILQLFVNGMQAAPHNRLKGLDFDPREHNASVGCVGDEHVAKFWMILNNRTFNTFENMSCRFNGVLSDTAYISNVVYICERTVNELVVSQESQSVANCSCNQNQTLHEDSVDINGTVFPTVSITSVVLCLLILLLCDNFDFNCVSKFVLVVSPE